MGVGELKKLFVTALFSVVPFCVFAELTKITTSNYTEYGLVDAEIEQYDGFYAITNGNELKEFATMVNNGDALVNALLLSDITFNEGRNLYDTDDSSLEMWTPIGTDDSPFYGTFEGRGHSITGLYTNILIQDAGLIGRAINARVKDVAIYNSRILGYNAGAICGRSDSTSIDNCLASAYLGAVYAGGICGNSYRGTTISNCFSSCSSFSSSIGGGLVGYAHKYTAVSYSASVGTSDVGGRNPGPDTYILFTCHGSMVGASEGDLTMTSCFADSSVCPRWDIYYMRVGKYELTNVKNFTTVPMTMEMYDSLGGMLSDKWKTEKGFYPMQVSYDDTLTRLLSVPVILNEDERYDSVSTNFALPQHGSLQWVVSSESHGRYIPLGSEFNVDSFPGKDTLYAMFNGVPLKALMLNVKPVIYDSVFIADYPSKRIYKVGDSLCTDSGRVALLRDTVLIYIDISRDMITGFDSSTGGTKELLVYYKGACVGHYDVMVERRVDSSFIYKLPQQDYKYGDTLNVSEGSVFLHYDDNSSDEIPLCNTTILGFDSHNVGLDTLTVVYDGDTVARYVVNIQPVIKRVEIGSYPKKEYLVDDTLDLSGADLVITYEDGRVDTIPMIESMVPDFSTKKCGNFEFDVYFEGNVIGSIPVSVSHVINRIEMYAMPKTSYFVGDSLCVSNGMLSLIYNDGDKDTVVISPDMVTGFNSDKADSLVLLVSYLNFSTSYNVVVMEKESTSLSPVSASPRLLWVCSHGIVYVYSAERCSAVLQDLQGRVIRLMELEKGENAFTNIHDGVYLFNNEKVVVK